MKDNIAFLGAGAMGEALINGLLQSKLVVPEQIRVYDICPSRRGQLKQVYGLEIITEREELPAVADIVILAVKPQNIEEALAGLQFPKNLLFISIVAGLTLARLENILGEIALVRVMPNTPALVGEGISALAANNFVSQQDLKKALTIFTSVGRALVLPEEQLDAVTGLSGSGPAYIYLIIEAMADAGVRQGLPRAVAMQLAAQTVLGAAQMVMTTGEHPGVLKDKVTSPAGTTIAGLTILEERCVRGAMIRAVEAACLRAQSLNKEKS